MPDREIVVFVKMDSVALAIFHPVLFRWATNFGFRRSHPSHDMPYRSGRQHFSYLFFEVHRRLANHCRLHRRHKKFLQEKIRRPPPFVLPFPLV